jgi:hypothetical protein
MDMDMDILEQGDEAFQRLSSLLQGAGYDSVIPGAQVPGAYSVLDSPPRSAIRPRAAFNAFTSSTPHTRQRRRRESSGHDDVAFPPIRMMGDDDDDDGGNDINWETQEAARAASSLSLSLPAYMKRIDVQVKASWENGRLPPVTVTIRDVLPERHTVGDLKSLIATELRSIQQQNLGVITLKIGGVEYEDAFNVGSVGVVSNRVALEVSVSSQEAGALSVAYGSAGADPTWEEHQFCANLLNLERSGAIWDESQGGDVEEAGALLRLLQEYRDVCEEKRSELQLQLRSLVGHSALQHGISEEAAAGLYQREIDTAKFFRQERDTWDLFNIMLQCSIQDASFAEDARSDPDRWSRSHSTSDPCAADDYVLNALYRRDQEVRLLGAVAEWLEGIAGESVSITESGGSTRQFMDATLRRFAREGPGPRVAGGGARSIDPDGSVSGSANSASGFHIEALDETDEHDEEELLRGAWLLLRAGRWAEAVQLCVDRRAHWLAASLSGGVMIAEEDEEGNLRLRDAKPGGNPRRSLWREMCWSFSAGIRKGLGASGRGAGSAPLEAAIYASLAGDVEGLLSLPLMRSWEDQAWALFVAARRRAEDVELLAHREAQAQASTLFPGVEIIDHDRRLVELTSGDSQLSAKVIFARLQSSACHEVREQSQDLFYQVQAATILGEDTLRKALVSVLAPAACATPPPAPHLLRFAAHAALYVKRVDPAISPEGDSSSWEAFEGIIAAYADHLTRTNRIPLIAGYVAHLSPPRRADAYVALMASVLDAQGRQECVDGAREHFPEDLAALTKRVVVETRAMAGASDSIKLRSLQWLCLADEHRGEALVQTNALVRQLVQPPEGGDSDSCWDHERTQTVSLLLTGDRFVPSMEETRRVLRDTQQTVADHVVASALREHDCWTAFHGAIEAFSAWKTELRGNPLPETRLPSGAASSREEEMRQSHVRLEAQKDMTVISSRICSVAAQSRDCLRAVLTFPGGWLYCPTTDVESESLQDGDEEISRQSELAQLRRWCLSPLVMMLHETLHETGEWLKVCSRHANESAMDTAAALWLREAQQVADLVASDDYCLYDDLPSDKLRLVIRAVHASSLALLAWADAPSSLKVRTGGHLDSMAISAA